MKRNLLDELTKLILIIFVVYIIGHVVLSGLGCKPVKVYTLAEYEKVCYENNDSTYLQILEERRIAGEEGR